MEKNIFISHSSYDKEIVKIFSELIKKVSLSQIHIWFSNDIDTEGGFLAGDNWFDSIINHITRSRVVITFITPNSNNQPWILYESGYAAALEHCTLVPVKFSIDISDVSTPLQHKQIYNLSGIEDLHIFLGKILHLFDIVYDREVFQEIVQSYLKRMRDCWNPNNSELENSNYDFILNKLEQKMEYYFGKIGKVEKSEKIEKYDVILEYKLGKNDKREYLTIHSDDTVQDILDEIYYMISDVVKPYKYLESWVLLEKRTQRAAIISGDIYDWIPAQSIFKINSLWKVVYLDKPLINQ